MDREQRHNITATKTMLTWFICTEDGNIITYVQTRTTIQSDYM